MLTKEIERRKPVWLAISEFYLDTELSNTDLIRISEIFKKSGYSEIEIKEIDFYEVYPIVGSNLLSIAGVWEGFDEEWLFNEILSKRVNKKRTKGIFYFFRKKWLGWMTKQYWS